MRLRQQVLMFIVACMASHAQAKDFVVPEELFNLDLEQLQNVRVVTAAKKSQRLYDSAAAVYVISSHDIERSGATHIAELLRTVPGLNVARIDSNKWAVSARGFNGRLANKLLVLIDGRSVYSPIFAGVLWDDIDMRLEDIDRIEVVRGPGSTLWGANAVNGVINIITKSAQQSQNAQITALLGKPESQLSARVASGNEASALRVFGKTSFNRESASAVAYAKPEDRWNNQRAGLRWDTNLAAGKSLMLSSELYQSEIQETNLVPSAALRSNEIQKEKRNNHGGYLLTRYTSGTDNQVTTGQFYVDFYRREDVALLIDARTVDAEIQHQFNVQNNDIIFGLGARQNHDDTDPGQVTRLTPASATHTLYNLFIQDEISAFDDHLKLTLGNKFEHYDYVDTESLPNIRALWKVSDNTAVWTAASKSVRTPDRVERDTYGLLSALDPLQGGNPFSLPVLAYVHGNPDFKLEKITSYELGFRTQLGQNLEMDIASFYSKYKNGITFEPTSIRCQPSDQSLPCAPTDTYISADAMTGNNLNDNSKGIEAVLRWTATGWDVETNFTYQEHDFYYVNNSQDKTR
ncbi:MAG TPA: TonB-dependent receptor, partial [Pseudomonadales bacterium]|nr:TonB-dependent receptor [Pseudomonadales bacterium]